MGQELLELRDKVESDSEASGRGEFWTGHQFARLPQFPDFVPLAAEHKPLLDAAFEAVQPEISELTFAYQWTWRRYINCHVGRFREAMLLMAHNATTSEPYLLPPITASLDRAGQIIREVLKSAERGAPALFARVPEKLTKHLEEDPNLSVIEEPERADYIYLGEDLRELPGRRYHGKRNHIRQFWSACPQAQYRAMDETLADQCSDFCREWLARHPHSDSPSVRREVDAALTMLADRQWLGLVGGALIADERIVGFSMGEPINRDTFVIRAEKSNTSFPGVYQAINQEFARNAAARYKWINREQDLGIPGLRRAKKSYYPRFLLRKYRVTLA